MATSYQARTFYGPFKRLAAERVQTPQTMRAQIESGELWGRTPRRGTGPAAQAHVGALRDDQLGFEFYVETPPESAWGTHTEWRPRADGTVWLDGEFAKVKIYVARVTMGIA